MRTGVWWRELKPRIQFFKSGSDSADNMQQASNRQMDIVVELDQKQVGALQQQIEAPQEVVKHEIPGSETSIPWPTTFWIRDNMIQT